ncbi:CsbD family protein [Streptomyces sp. CA-210063]|uniref:CsbD family protein n=1 Tax=Streptomyces sp. CA-210063 TaxID=2801029 RepID=UPI00214C57C8|nr:CsbD family protein [Streptomyces sp. CA-210063]UUU33779.1 CsbD family protein [Streptomyces sp. CA-210063]
MAAKGKSKGNMDKIKGKAKEMSGKVTGDREQQVEGKMEQARGDAKKMKGKAQERVEETQRSAKRDRT